MASVSSTDGGYNYAQRNLAELEEEIRAEAKDRRQSVDGELETQRARQLEQRRELETETEETLDEYRRGSAESHTRDRENTRAEVDRMKKTYYDRFGRQGAREQESARRAELERVQSNADLREEQLQRQVSQTERRGEERLDQAHTELEGRLSREIDQLRTTQAESIERSREARLLQDQQSRVGGGERANAVERARALDAEAEKRRLQETFDGSRRDFERRLSGAEELHARKSDVTARAASAELEGNTAAFRDSRERETAALRDVTKRLLAGERERLHTRGEDARVEIDLRNREWGARQDALVDSYERALERTKKGSLQVERRIAGAAEELQRERDYSATRAIQGREAEFSRDRRDLENAFQADRRQLVDRATQDRAAAEKRGEDSVARGAGQAGRALEAQAMAFGRSLKDQQVRDRTELARLQEELAFVRTTDDPSQISPQAEARIRQALEDEVGAGVRADSERQKRAVEQIRERYSGETREERAKALSERTASTQARTIERHVDQMSFAATINEVEHSKEKAISQQSQMHDKQAETQFRENARQMETMRREYEDLLTSTKADSQLKFQTAQAETRFERQMEQRAFAQRQNELIRNYEKQLSDQKRDLETIIDDQKQQLQSTERRMTKERDQALATAERNHEQRLKQIEAQTEERSKLVAQNYQEQLEKVTKSNALLIQRRNA